MTFKEDNLMDRNIFHPVSGDKKKYLNSNKKYSKILFSITKWQSMLTFMFDNFIIFNFNKKYWFCFAL